MGGNIGGCALRLPNLRPSPSLVEGLAESLPNDGEGRSRSKSICNGLRGGRAFDDEVEVCCCPGDAANDGDFVAAASFALRFLNILRTPSPLSF